MKNVYLYNFCAITPLPLLIYLSKMGVMNSTWFCFFLFFYAFPYRFYIYYLRLRSKNVVQRNEMYSLMIPGNRIKYFRELYFN